MLSAEEAKKSLEMVCAGHYRERGPVMWSPENSFSRFALLPSTEVDIKYRRRNPRCESSVSDCKDVSILGSMDTLRRIHEQEESSRIVLLLFTQLGPHSWPKALYTVPRWTCNGQSLWSAEGLQSRYCCICTWCRNCSADQCLARANAGTALAQSSSWRAPPSQWRENDGSDLGWG